MLIDNHAIAQGELLRAQIAAATAEFIRNGGEIFIVDNIRPQEPPKPTWNNNQGNRSAEDASRRRGVKSSAASKRAGGNTNKHREQRRRNVELIKPLLDQGLSSYQIAPLVGLTDRSVRNIISMEGLRDRP